MSSVAEKKLCNEHHPYVTDGSVRCELEVGHGIHHTSGTYQWSWPRRSDGTLSPTTPEEATSSYAKVAGGHE